MRVAILTFGSRGDVQPYLALAKGLQARGHDVTLGAPDNFADWVSGHGVRFHGLGIDIEALLKSEELRSALSGKIWRLARIWHETVMPIMRNVLEQTWIAGRDAEVIVYHPKAHSAVDVAEATGAFPICASVIPVFPTGEFPVVVLPGSLGSWLNRQTHRGFEISRGPYRKLLDAWRRETLGLGPGPVVLPLGRFNGRMGPRLCAISPAVLPRPADWDSDIHLTGYWFFDESREQPLDPALQAFLEAGEPPVYVGFGSMTTGNPEKVAREAIEGLRLAGVRAVLATGWGGLERIDPPDGVHIVNSAPHDALFPRVAAVVHHGGAGTTAAGLRAGRPTLIQPVFGDQPFWGRRVAALGCGPAPRALLKLKAGRFARALERLVGDPSYAERAAEVAAGIAADDGVARAVEVIEAAAPVSG